MVYNPFSTYDSYMQGFVVHIPFEGQLFIIEVDLMSSDNLVDHGRYIVAGGDHRHVCIIQIFIKYCLCIYELINKSHTEI